MLFAQLAESWMCVYLRSHDFFFFFFLIYAIHCVEGCKWLQQPQVTEVDEAHKHACTSYCITCDRYTHAWRCFKEPTAKLCSKFLMNHNFTIKETKYDESALMLLNLKTELWCQKSSIWFGTDEVKLPSECFSVWRSVLCLFSWASLICHCVSSGLSPSVLCLNQIFLFLFVFTTHCIFRRGSMYVSWNDTHPPGCMNHTLWFIYLLSSLQMLVFSPAML